MAVWRGSDHLTVYDSTQGVFVARNGVVEFVPIKLGISGDKSREINRMIKEKGPKGVSSQTQGESVRVTGKKRDDLQAVMSMLKGADLEIPLQFNNMRD